MRNFEFTEISDVDSEELVPSTGPLFAKSYGHGDLTLSAHSIEAGRMSLTLLNHIVYDNSIETKLRRCALIAGIFHDLGKGAVGFQNMIRKSEVKRWPDDGKGGNRHEILSCAILLQTLGALENWKLNVEDLQSIYLAIIAHHKPYRKMGESYPRIIPENQWFGGYQFNEMYSEIYVNRELMKDTWNKIINKIKSDGWGRKLIESGWLPEELIINSPEMVNKKLDELLKIYGIHGYDRGLIFRDEYNRGSSKREKSFQILIRVLTTVGDHLSSGGILSIPSTPDFSQYNFSEDPSIYPWKFQLECGNYMQSIMLRAPTGSGKTEAAINWIRSNQFKCVEEGILGKVFYVLPFQASLNAMYKRINKWLGVEIGQVVGLQHSRSSDSLFSILEDEIHHLPSENRIGKIQENAKILTISKKDYTDLIFKNENRNKIGSSSKLAYSLATLTRETFYPIKVTTPHQILKGLLQGRGWEIMANDLNKSVIVFDEIHAYDPHIVGLILNMANLLIDNFGVRIFFMSASFPDFLIQLIRDHLHQNMPLVTLDSNDKDDNKILEKLRHKIVLKEETITDLILNKKIYGIINNHESVLIICNTVITAQNTYLGLKSFVEKKYGDNSIILFHSRFKIKDRQLKEKRIIGIEKDKNLRVIIATQVVEVSLDIDLGFGIFEAAPLDALIQRMGRVNRKGIREIDEPNIWIAKSEGFSHLIYDKDQTNYSFELLKEVENHAITENDLVDLINRLYQEFPWNDYQWRKFNNALKYERISKFYDNIFPASYRYWIDDVLEGQTSVDVILREDIAEYKRLKNKSFLRANGLIVPVRAYKKELDTSNYRLPPVLNLEYEYSSELGLKIKRGKKK